jgi:hypothetical protein
LAPDEAEPGLEIGIPNARNTVWRRIRAERAAYIVERSLLGITVALGDYESYYFKDAGLIEARFRDARNLRSITYPKRIPGSVFMDGDGNPLELSDEELRRILPGNRRGVYWKVRLVRDFPAGIDVELGSASERFIALDGRAYVGADDRSALSTIRISGVSVDTHDEALSLLIKVSDAVFFDLDVCFELPCRLVKDSARMSYPSWRGRAAQCPPDNSPKFPVNQYASEPLSLYWYARSADSMPLLAYLAYYQVLEYYFPQYTHRETLNQLRNELRSPKFRSDSDSDLSRLVRIASRAGRGSGFGSEREQLRATISATVSEDEIRDYISAIPERVDYFEGRQSIRDLPTVQLRVRKNDNCSQLANRVYDLRCRIVHSKEDGGDAGGDLLLPFSREVETIWPDIELLKFLAREVLIAGAGKLHT